MIFQHTWKDVLSGRKTQTRRLVDADDEMDYYRRDASWVKSRRPQRVKKNGRTKWCVGNRYAVQPGRGKKAVGHIRITAIRRERLWDITDADAIAEGCNARIIGKIGHGEPPFAFTDVILRARGEFTKLWDSIHTKPGTRWEDNPEVWVLAFEVIDE